MEIYQFNINNTNFINNSALFSGGSIYVDKYDDFQINNVSIINSTAKFGGGLSTQYGMDQNILYNKIQFINNEA